MISTLSVSLQEGSIERGYRLTWNFGIYPTVFADNAPQVLRSLGYALTVTLICLAVAYPLAYAIAFRGGRWKNALLFLVVLPFFVSLVIRTLSWRLILADQGWLLDAMRTLGLTGEAYHVLGTRTAVIGGMIYNFLPFMALPLYVALERMDRSLLDAAADLYSSRVRAFLHVTLPLSIPGIFAGSLLTFIPAVGDFINADLLGGVNTFMIGNVIQFEFLTAQDYPAAAALSFVLMAGMLIGVAAYAKLLGTEDLTG